MSLRPDLGGIQVEVWKNGRYRWLYSVTDNCMQGPIGGAWSREAALRKAERLARRRERTKGPREHFDREQLREATS